MLRQKPRRLPVQCLPANVRRIVEAVSAELQVPPDFPLLVLLAAAAAATRGRVRVQVRPGWFESLSLYVAPLLSSGNRKSAVLEWFTKPFQAVEQELRIAARGDFAQAESEQRVAAKRLERLEREVADGKAEPAELEAARAELLKCEVKPLPRLLIGDATPEAVVQQLAEQSSVALLSAEGGAVGLFTGDRYGNGTPNLDALLQAHSGEQIRVDRKGSESLLVTSPHLVLCIAAQPDVLLEMRSNRQMRDRGFLSRFLFVLPESLLGTRKARESVPVPAAVAAEWETALRRLVFREQQRVLPLSPDSREQMLDFQDSLETGKVRATAGEWQQGFLSKLPGQLARVAALFELLANPDAESVSTESLTAALSLSEWLCEHAELAGSEYQPGRAELLLQYLMKCAAGEGVQQFTKSWLHQKLKGGHLFRHSESLDEPLRQLAELNWLQRVPIPLGQVGRPAEPWAINPKALEVWRS